VTLHFERSKLEEGSKALGLDLNTSQMTQFELYCSLLYTWNERFNLTAIPWEQFVTRHALDSLTLAPRINSLLAEAKGQKALSLADIGSGAGLPGIPLAIAFPQISVCLIESIGKRCTFLDTCIKELKLTNTRVIHERAEIAGHRQDLRERFTLVTARAVARLSILLELLSPFAEVDGRVIPLKSSETKNEIGSLMAPVKRLSITFARDQEVMVPGEERSVYLPEFLKTKPLSPDLPRHYSVIQRKPFEG
jgi:16S rRNA (guanine527-N7)-methyltransferase